MVKSQTNSALAYKMWNIEKLKKKITMVVRNKFALLGLNWPSLPNYIGGEKRPVLLLLVCSELKENPPHFCIRLQFVYELTVTRGYYVEDDHKLQIR